MIVLMIMNIQGRSSVNAAGDSTGFSTQMYGRLITDKGAVPYIAVRKGVRAYSLGYSAWHEMISNWREDKAVMSTITGGA